jgi:hypothetical protein
VWQALHEEISPQGVDIVTVALDTDVEAARPYVDAVRPTHLALADPAHLTVAALGFLNVPSAVWVDTDGTVVRGPDVAFTGRGDPPPVLPVEERSRMEPLPRLMHDLQHRAHTDGRRYLAAVRDWAARDADSPHVPDQAATRPWGEGAARAAAHFALAHHLHRTGHPRDAVAHFTEAQRLDPANWSYQRQARALADPAWAGAYDDLLARLAELGADEFYPPLTN